MKRTVFFNSALAELDLTAFKKACQVDMFMMLLAEANDTWGDSKVVTLTDEHFQFLNIEPYALSMSVIGLKKYLLNLHKLDGTPVHLFEDVKFCASSDSTYVSAVLTDQGKEWVDSSKKSKGMYISFDLLEFIQLRHLHTKMFYVFMKQFKLSGHIVRPRSYMIYRLGITAGSYTRVCTILGQVFREVAPYFEGFDVKVQKYAKTNKIQTYTIVFVPQVAEKGFSKAGYHTKNISGKGERYDDLYDLYASIDHDALREKKANIEKDLF